jgi:hypothetical protein
LASEMIWGAPRNPFHYVSFFGSILLLVAALAAPFSARVSAKIALGGLAAAWCFYAPAIIVSSLAPFAMWQEIKIDASSRDWVPLVGILFGPLLLLVATLYAISVLKHSPRSA